VEILGFIVLFWKKVFKDDMKGVKVVCWKVDMLVGCSGVVCLVSL